MLVLLLAVPAAAQAAPDRSDDGTKPAKPVDMLPTTGEKAVAVALRYLGTPYSWAGASPAGFDCSGFVMYVYGKLGIGLPHSSWMLWNVGRQVDRGHLQAGDIVFFNGESHVGIYMGQGRFVHSPHTGDVVRISSFSEGWYGSTFDGGRRVG
ncbi:MAG TPA: C40 family peptidase [Gaiellaceae bacterium]|nr:C40 family peptidase [Gaiellaceae bacterium]